MGGGSAGQAQSATRFHSAELDRITGGYVAVDPASQVAAGNDARDGACIGQHATAQ